MRKLEIRSIICLALAAILILGTGVFVFRFVKYGSKWATFYGNRSIYENGVLKSGAIYDRNDVLLAKSGGGEVKYNDDPEIREATVHAVGDVNGKISTSALSAYKDKLIGYNLLTGTYKLKGKNEDLKLTLDADVCKEAYRQLSKYDAGCIGIYNYKTGEIICMVSTPTFDPENEPSVSADDQSGLYLNRFLSSKLPPGSIFKTVTAAAAIENTDYQNFSYDCDGTRVIHGEDLNCAYPHGHVDLGGALLQSCNGAFSVLADEMGADIMKDYVDRLGLTKSYNIDGIRNAKGSFDFPKDSELNLGWAGVGQYHDLVNPCSMMVYMGAIANGGKAAIPHILMSDFRITKMTNQMIDESTAEILSEMMKKTVENGYIGATNLPNLDVYAKTGTAESAGKKPYGWFAGFLKDENHPYAFIVCLENSGEAYYTALPVANSVLQVAVSK